MSILVNNGLICESLGKVYSGSKGRKALDDVDLNISSNGIFSIIGMNGAGKTTLVRILATQLTATTGKATIEGLDVMEDAKRLRGRIACIPQEARTVPWMTPKQTVLSYLLWRGLGYREASMRAVETLAKMGLQNQENTLNRRLSGGMKRKVLVATVLSSDADIIFLDEPTTGLDPISRQELWKFLLGLAEDRFLVLTTHYLEEAERVANVIGIMHRGKMIRSGSLEQLRSTIPYQYSIMVASGTQLPNIRDGVVTKAPSGKSQILANEAEAHEVSSFLLDTGTKFSMSEVSLEDVFFHLVHSTDTGAGAS
jgi:ABC-2 type transport system ATP-binding protein